MLRALLLPACALVVLAGCSNDDDNAATSAPPTLGAIDGAADAGATGAETVSPVGTADLPVDSADVPVVPLGTSDLPIVPVGTDDIPIVPTQTVDLPTPDGGIDAKIVALAPSDVCALTPADELEAIVGTPLTEPIETDLNDLGAACYFVEDVDGGSATVSGVELNTFDFVQQIDATSDKVQECTIAGRTAYCQEAFGDDSTRVDATVVVALGGDADPALVVSSSVGLDAAKAIAELALSNLTL